MSNINSHQTFEPFLANYSKGRNQICYRVLLADTQTAVAAMLKLSNQDSYSCLLESVEGGKVRGRFSVIAIKPDLIWRCKGNLVEINRNPEKYPNDLELIIDGQIPLNDYLDIMKRSNIVIDQTSSYSLGMNGLFALAMGKVVLGGAEKEGLDSLRIKESPVINILPSQESIVNAIEILIKNKSEISTLGEIGRKFIETHHCSLKIAMQFEQTWKTN